MSNVHEIDVEQVASPAQRAETLSVLRETYRDEKHWIDDESTVFPIEDLDNEHVAWFLATSRGQPAGVLRVHYAPPLHLYRQYNLKMTTPGIDVEGFINDNAIAEIGRFAVVPKQRRHLKIVAALMRAATADTIARGFTHYITDVFEGETHSPYHFHTRVFGFTPVATHEVGEMNCANRRITLILNLREAYHRLAGRRNRVFRSITEGWDEQLHKRLSA